MIKRSALGAACGPANQWRRDLDIEPGFLHFGARRCPANRLDRARHAEDVALLATDAVIICAQRASGCIARPD